MAIRERKSETYYLPVIIARVELEPEEKKLDITGVGGCYSGS
jgi:hypothetical protein